MLQPMMYIDYTTQINWVLNVIVAEELAWMMHNGLTG